MNDDLNTFDPNSPEYIDGLASLCLDAEMTLDQVPQEFRSAVQKRMSQFAEQRRRLQSSVVVVDQATVIAAVEAIFSNSRGQVVALRRRRFVVYIGSLAAAAACVAIVGVAINQNSPSEQADQFSSKVSLVSDSLATDNAAPESATPTAYATTPESSGSKQRLTPHRSRSSVVRANCKHCSTNGLRQAHCPQPSRTPCALMIYDQQLLSGRRFPYLQINQQKFTLM